MLSEMFVFVKVREGLVKDSMKGKWHHLLPASVKVREGSLKIFVKEIYNSVNSSVNCACKRS